MSDAISTEPISTQATSTESRPGWAAWLLGTGILGAAVLLVIFGLALQRASGALEPGSQAPDFELETFEGRTLRLSDLRGQVVVLNFWASWCAPCAMEAPELEALWREYRDRGVTLIGVAYTDTRPAALDYIERFEISYPNGMDRADRISRSYRLSGVPETLVIDAEGRIVPLRLGPGAPVDRMVGQLGGEQALTGTELRSLIDRLLDGAEG